MSGNTRFIEPDAAGGAAVRALNAMVADITSNAADLLTKSCLYFTLDNIRALGPPPDMAGKLERLDPALRAALIDGDMGSGAGERFRALMECKVYLEASVRSACLAAQLFTLLRDSKTPSSGLMPLCKVINAATRAIRASAFAIRDGNPALAGQAASALIEAEKMGRELDAVLPTLATYRSPTLCRMIRASVFAALSSAATITETAARLTADEKAKAGAEGLKPLPL
jgi:hypothetical protein